ncbi:NUDIX hydrolase [Roseicella aquatilis]|uniref:NUDIX hydrolase n=1 Tax=Roseicella aquatilis TaxID=2527868 RepID=A0A4R4DTL4_9PROT|nr:NUDIX hydrolase [Roseicella aquatilis]TCZ65362.1 NUDIX hydrolase [Roseicella aquatilis]
MTEAKPPVPVRPAATVLLARDGAEGIEVFMVVRHREIEFAGGALVFPGGRVEEDDRRLGGPDPLDGYRIAGIRETFEECGVLLARPKGSAALVDATRLLGIEALHRVRVAKGEQPLSAMLAEEELEPAIDGMVHFAHWITPASRSKRFDTQFFLAAAPPDQVAVHDGHESEDSVWIRPLQACQEANEGRRRLVFPTRKNLEKLARYATVAEALAACRQARVVTVTPEMVQTEAGWRLSIPAEADYGGSVFDVLDAPAI